MEHTKQHPQYGAATVPVAGVPDGYDHFQVHPTGYPFHQYEPIVLEPCAIVNNNGPIQQVHMLACGHIVAIDSLKGPVDNRCGLNCFHVANWIRQQTMDAPMKNINLHTGTTLGHAPANATPLSITKKPIVPPISQWQCQDTIFCEICAGIPVSSFFIMQPHTQVKRALALTRPVIEHFTHYTFDQIEDRLCRPFFNNNHLAFDHKLAHVLCCGHEVWAQPARPCAANCSDTPACRGRIFPGNQKQGDMIICQECVYRAEKVYERYARTGKGVAQEVVSRSGLNAPVKFDQRASVLQDTATYGVATSGFDHYQEFAAADGMPVDPVPEKSSFSSSAGKG